MAFPVDIAACEDLIHQFSSLRILVVGDIILDEYIWGEVHRICPEAPVPVVDVARETRLLGGATNVVKNIATLGGKTTVVGIRGNDRAGEEIGRFLSDLGVSSQSLILDPSRPTSIKTRIIGGNQQIVRFDRERRFPLPSEIIRSMMSRIEEEWEEADAVVISDYGKGVVSAQLMEGIKGLYRRCRKCIIVDPKEKNMHLYEGVTVITPNKKEAINSYGLDLDIERDPLSVVGQALVERLGCEYLVVTLGADGMAIFCANEKGRYDAIPTFAKEVFDVSGAGDTVVGTLSLSLAAGANIHLGAALANLAAGLVVAKLGTASVTREELIGALRNHPLG